MKKIFTSLCLCLCLTGCIAYFPRSYSPKVKTKTYDLAETQKVPLTFSLETNLIKSDSEPLVEKIRESLEETGLFSTVTFVPDGAIVYDGYHISFGYQRWIGANVSIFFCIFSLGLLPAEGSYYVDGAATVYLRGEEIADFTKVEKVTDIQWWPCVIIWPFANGYFAWDRVENKIVNGLVNDFTKYHMERFRQ